MSLQRAVSTLLICSVFTVDVFAGSGKITGIVRSAENGQTLLGARVQIDGTQLEALTDSRGMYFLLGVVPGLYSLTATATGFVPQTTTSVRIAADQIVEIHFDMKFKEVGIDEIVVEASRPVIDQSQTAARTVFSSDELRELPVQDVRGALSISPSLYNGFMRGGRQFETKVVIDGVDVTDQFYGAAADQTVSPYLIYNGLTRHAQAQTSALVDASLSSLEEIDVLTGGVGSDYSSATAGIISYTLRAGQGEWSGRADVRVSQAHLGHIGPRVYNDDTAYARERVSMLDQDPQRGALYTYYPGKYSYGQKPATLVALSAGGGLGEHAGLFLATEYRSSFGRLPNEFHRELHLTSKLNYRISPDIHLNAVGILQDKGRLFGWKNRNYSEDFRYFLEGVPQWDGVTVVGSVKLMHALSSATFYEVQVSYVRSLTRRGFSDDDNDGTIELGEGGDFLTFADTTQVYRYMAHTGGSDLEKFFTPKPKNEAESATVFRGPDDPAWKIARPGIFYERFVDATATLKCHFTSQVSHHHQLTAGIQTRQHTLGRILRASYFDGVFPSYKNYVEEIWNAKPRESGLYLQDKIEYSGLIVNVGFRLDAIDLNASDYANYFAPFRDDTTRNTNGDIVDLQRVPIRGPEIKTKLFFSPRVGVSHPISDNASMYFSFSRQQQPQPFSRIYSNYNDFGNPALPNVLRVDQDPLRSTTYELGMQWAFANGIGLDATAYYKDIQNYSAIGLSVTPESPWKTYNVSTDFGYADARGIEISIKKNISSIADFISAGGRISYAYTYIKQSVYAGDNVTGFSTGGGDSALYNGGLPFGNLERFHTIERNVLGSNSTLTGGYDRTHRIAFNVVLRFPAGFSLSGIGEFDSGFFHIQTLTDLRARELGVGPWTKRVDLRLEKIFTIRGYGRISLYVDILNAFNWTNVLAYQNGTVGQVEWEKNGDPTGGPRVNRPVTQDGSMIYDIPREVYFGLTYTL